MAMSKLQEQFEEQRAKSIEQRSATTLRSQLSALSSVWPCQIMQIHDSIMVECKEADAEKISEMMVETMESIKPDLGVNLKVDVSIGANWGEL
jgi:DNA polymerase I-like protein with 3'-5' exonuclease and polymerase domains